MSNERILKGTTAAPGVATGPVLLYSPLVNTEQSHETLPPEQEIARLDDAIIAADAIIASAETQLRDADKAEEAEIFAAHRMLLSDPSLRDRAVALINDEQQSAVAAIGTAGEEQAQMLLELDDEYLQARATDVRDVVAQVQRALVDGEALGDQLREPAIIVARDLGPSELMSVPREKLLGFALAAGGQTAHSTILARSLGIPAIIGLGDATLEQISSGVSAILDGGAGTLTVDPADATIARMQQTSQQQSERQAELRSQRDLPSVTIDGQQITLMANASSPLEAQAAHEWRAAGVGLLRTELLFLGRDTMPSEDEQLALYQAVAAELPGMPIVVRTLDVGGDKDLPAFPLPKEDNPFLGWRGIRIGLSQPDVLLPQLRALLRAGADADIHIMVPMIATLEEVRRVRSLIQQAHEELASANIAHTAQPQIGVMIEVPAAALMADHLAQEVDFFSIGTNDLTQYTLACDRTNQRVAELYHPLEPAVLRLIAMTAEAAHRHGCHVAVCGEMAGDPHYTALLVGLGVDELSCAPTTLPRIREAVRATNARAARTLAQSACAAASRAEVQALLAP